MADRCQDELAKWQSYAGATLARQAIAAMTMPRARWLAYLLHRVHFASLVALKHSAVPLPLLSIASLSLSSSAGQ